MDHNPQARRPHYHRGRRGPDRRGSDRRAPQSQEQTARPSGEQVDVEQIMRDIRARIAQRHGIELSTQQIQELAARRLEAILDPRNVSPSLMEQLRRGAAAPPPAAPAPDPGYAFEDTTLYESHRGVLRFMRRLLNPILKLFFNPNPLIHALRTQARLNREALAREAERERIQAEWNALHYEVVQRLVTEVSRVSLEMQALALRVESLTARVDFNDKRVRAIEATSPQGRTQPRLVEPVAVPTAEPQGTPPESAGAESTPSEGTRRRRRRRRGRRGGAGPADAGAQATAVAVTELAGAEPGELDEGDDEAPEPAAAELPEPVAPPSASTAAPADVTGPPEQPMPPHDEPVAALPTEDPNAGPPER